MQVRGAVKKVLGGGEGWGMPGAEAPRSPLGALGWRAGVGTGLEGKLGYMAGELLSLRQDIFLFSSSH